MSEWVNGWMKKLGVDMIELKFYQYKKKDLNEK